MKSPYRYQYIYLALATVSLSFFSGAGQAIAGSQDMVTDETTVSLTVILNANDKGGQEGFPVDVVGGGTR